MPWSRVRNRRLVAYSWWTRQLVSSLRSRKIPHAVISSSFYALIRRPYKKEKILLLLLFIFFLFSLPFAGLSLARVFCFVCSQPFPDMKTYHIMYIKSSSRGSGWCRLAGNKESLAPIEWTRKSKFSLCVALVFASSTCISYIGAEKTNGRSSSIKFIHEFEFAWRSRSLLGLSVHSGGSPGGGRNKSASHHPSCISFLSLCFFFGILFLEILFSCLI